MRDTILAEVGDLIGCFLYYDRKEDERMPVGAIEKAIGAGEISGEEIAAHFKLKLLETLEEKVDE